MIAKMLKTYVVSKRQRREGLLEALRNLGVVHLAPVDGAKAVAHEETVAAIDRLRRAQQLLGAVAPAGESPRGATTIQAAEEALAIHRVAAERRNRLANLHRQIDQLAVWGDARLDQFAALREAGVPIKFFSLPARDAGAIVADLVAVVAESFGRGVLVAVVRRGGEPEVPDSAEPVELPPRDRRSLRGEAAEIDMQLTADEKRLAELAHLAKDMQEEIDRLTSAAQFTIAERGGLAEGELYAVQGWVPADQAETLRAGLAGAGIDAAVETAELTEDDQPPTLIRYPGWVKPIKGLFDILGTLPGYRELDLTPYFMIALPVFAAMLIGDAGYGLLFIVLPALMYRKLTAAAGKPGTHLLMVTGAVTVAWGVLSGAYFGVSPQQMASAGGFWAAVARSLGPLQVISGDVKTQAYTIMKISFVMAAIQLSLGQLRQALALAPSLKALSKIGWAVFLWGIFFVIWFLFFDSQAKRPMHWLGPYLLVIGAVMAVVFASPNRNPLKMVGLGLADFPLGALGAFSDSLSYIRLMGVGLAGTVIAQTFNGLGAGVAAGATWFAGALVLILGHGLNVAMCMIAVLAHGVRLNMLEFSNNAGVQWGGYAYKPFATSVRKEQ
jgi:V/A-type H+-transporting ATPase subunit I